MVPEGWLPHRRVADGELAGYLAPVDADDTTGAADAARFIAMTVVGTVVDPESGALEEAAARALVEARGQAALDGTWWARLPKPLPAGNLHAAHAYADWEWRPVVIARADASRCVLRAETPWPEERHSRALLPVPVGELLRRVAPPSAARATASVNTPVNTPGSS
jgi:hypothetical protein